jgi:hypothetical protein
MSKRARVPGAPRAPRRPRTWVCLCTLENPNKNRQCTRCHQLREEVLATQERVKRFRENVLDEGGGEDYGGHGAAMESGAADDAATSPTHSAEPLKAPATPRSKRMAAEEAGSSSSGSRSCSGSGDDDDDRVSSSLRVGAGHHDQTPSVPEVRAQQPGKAQRRVAIGTASAAAAGSAAPDAVVDLTASGSPPATVHTGGEAAEAGDRSWPFQQFMPATQALDMAAEAMLPIAHTRPPPQPPPSAKRAGSHGGGRAPSHVHDAASHAPRGSSPRAAAALVFTREQRRVLEAVLMEGKSVFFTGAAGTGKSFILKHIIQEVRSCVRAVAVAMWVGTARARRRRGVLVHVRTHVREYVRTGVIRPMTRDLQPGYGMARGIFENLCACSFVLATPLACPHSCTPTLAQLYKVYDSRDFSITASAGVPAFSIGGITIHSFAGIGHGDEPVSELVPKIIRSQKVRRRSRGTPVACSRPPVAVGMTTAACALVVVVVTVRSPTWWLVGLHQARKRWNTTKVLIIDEISMLSGELLQKVRSRAGPVFAEVPGRRAGSFCCRRLVAHAMDAAAFRRVQAVGDRGRPPQAKLSAPTRAPSPCR